MTAVAGSRLFDLVPTGRPSGGRLLTLVPQQQIGRLEVLLQLPGCEAHVVSQAHKADDVAITVRVGSAAGAARRARR